MGANAEVRSTSPDCRSSGAVGPERAEIRLPAGEPDNSESNVYVENAFHRIGFIFKYHLPIGGQPGREGRAERLGAVRPRRAKGWVSDGRDSGTCGKGGMA